jgi:PLD-like domain/Trypsin-like peptidase domain
MADDGEYLRLLRNKAQQIMAKSPRMESMPGLEAVRRPETIDPVAPTGPHNESAQLEAVVRWYRPVLTVADDHLITQSGDTSDPRFVDPNEAASKGLMDALEKRRTVLDPALRSVGRIELTNNMQYPWVGTGWLIGSDLGSDIIVTNAHVGREFGMRSGVGYVFRPGIPNAAIRQSARIDFREEVKMTSPREFPITDIIWISELPGLDICLLRVARSSGADRIDPPISLITGALADSAMLAVAGYPGSNNGYDPAPFQKLFGSVTGNKRFSPGFYTGQSDGSVTYDCSTLPGSSGSVVLDVTSGAAVGLHFAGTAFETNYAVPAADIAKIIAKRPWAGEAPRPHTSMLGDDVGPAGGGVTLPSGAVLHSAGVGRGDGGLSFVVPLTITVQLGDQSVTAGVQRTTAPPPQRTDRKSAEAAAEKVRQHLLGNKSVLSVKADYLFRDGVITDDHGVIVGVAPGTAVDPASLGLGSRLDGVAISVETADPATIAEQMFAYQAEAFGGRVAKYRRDLTDPRFNLSPVTDDMSILLHVSPEAGWPVLKEFLKNTSHNRLTIGMYHMTAPHVVEAIEEIAGRNNTKITLTIDRQRGDADDPDDIGDPDKEDNKKKNDIPEEQTLDKLGEIAVNRFQWAPASLGAQGLFASAYHIKVAVWGDGASDASLFWLSSGNWQSSNQNPVDLTVNQINQVTPDQVEGYNREWHAVVTHKGLAKTFRNHLEQDFKDNDKIAQDEAPVPAMFDVLVPIGAREEAPSPRDFKVFPPKRITGNIKVQPLLTPDNYPEVIADLISQAQARVWIENQSFNFWKNADSMPKHFLNIAKAVRDQQVRGRDVRIIFRSGFGKERETLRQMKAFGLKADADHVRHFDKCHTKGFVIDDNIAVLGSQNITAAGVGPNRDASLVIWNRDANQYFAELFKYDWQQSARSRVRSDEGMAAVRLVHARDEAPAPSGYRRISMAEFLGET